MQKGPVDVRRSPIDRKGLEGEVVQIRDATTDPRFQYLHEAREEGIASVLCVPLRGDQGFVGVPRVYSAHPRHFGHRETRMLVALAAQAEITLSHAELHQQTLTFMRKVGHQLRTPLAAIGTILSVLLEGITGSLTEKQIEMLQRADRRTALLLQAVGELLSLSGARLEKSSDAQTEVCLTDIARSVTSLMRPQAEEAGIDLQVELDGEASRVTGVREDIEEIFTNLISNAIKYTERGGRVVASVETVKDRALVRVADTGIGIPKAELPRLFDEWIHRYRFA
jgi:signal transduction histidine kinase